MCYDNIIDSIHRVYKMVLAKIIKRLEYKSDQVVKIDLDEKQNKKC